MKNLVLAVMICIMPLAARDTLSVLYFENTAKDKAHQWLCKGITDMLITDLNGKIPMDIVERAEIQKVMQEQELGMTGAVDPAKAIAVGKLFAASRLLYGAFIVSGRSLRIDAKIVDAATGKVMKTFSVTGDTEKALIVQHELLLAVVQGFTGTAVPIAVPERKLMAVRIYYEGLDLLDMKRIEEARVKFVEASFIDPYYMKPQEGIEASYVYLKDFKRARFQRELIEAYDKLARLDARLRGTAWRTFAAASSERYFTDLKMRDKERYDREIYAYMQGDTPAVCTWNLQNVLGEIADMYEENFEDTNRAASMWREMISVAERSRKTFAKDPFLPEILYQALLAARDLELHAEVKTRAEELMTKFPKYRMMWAVEDMYETALKELVGK